MPHMLWDSGVEIQMTGTPYNQHGVAGEHRPRPCRERCCEVGQEMWYDYGAQMTEDPGTKPRKRMTEATATQHGVAGGYAAPLCLARNHVAR